MKKIFEHPAIEELPKFPKRDPDRKQKHREKVKGLAREKREGKRSRNKRKASNEKG